MRKKVRDTITEYQMFPRNARIIVGVSGGMDSIALLHLLYSWKDAEERAWTLTTVHIHHGLRGAEADLDQRFVEEFCASLGIPCIVRRFDVKAEAKRRGLGEEETGRLLRYEVFQEIAGEEGRIAVAHHQNDQAETLLMRLCRGTGLTGLAGMAPVRENICRPLLFCSREEIERYCRENHLQWREDRTNQQDIYTRNKLRLRILPLLEEINPKAAAHIAETAQLLAEEEDFLAQQAAEAYEKAVLPSPTGKVRLDRVALKTLHPALRRRVLRKAMAEFLPADASQAQIQALEDLLKKTTGKRRDLLGGVCAENCYETLVLSFQKEEKQKGFCYALPSEGEVYIEETDLKLTLWRSEKKEEIALDGCTNVFDYDKISENLFCRTRREGDFIRLSGGRKKIKELFIDEKIPRGEREKIPLITMGQEVLWISTLRVSAAYIPDEQTKTYLYIRIRRGQE